MGTSSCSTGFLLGICAAITLAAGAATASAAEKAHKPYAVWVVGEGEKNGHPVTVRWRDTMPDVDYKAAHPWCVEITWRFGHDAKGNVSREETERAADLDTMLDQEIENPEAATEVARAAEDRDLHLSGRLPIRWCAPRAGWRRRGCWRAGTRWSWGRRPRGPG